MVIGWCLVAGFVALYLGSTAYNNYKLRVLEIKMSREHDIRERLREVDNEYNEAAQEVGDITEARALTPDQQRRSTTFFKKQDKLNQEREELEKELWSAIHQRRSRG